MQKHEFYGKYRAIVIDNKDPKKLNRVKVKCPRVFENYVSGWCSPCFPIISLENDFYHDIEELTGVHSHSSNGSQKVGHRHPKRHLYRIPKVGEPIWIEFEQGDLSKPIWVGTWRCEHIE